MNALWPRLRRWWWLPALAAAFVLYSHSFNTFPILERQINLLGDSDAASFAVLLTDFSLTRRYGDEYQPSNRTIQDVAQKHKVHHFLYFVVGGVLYDVLHGIRGVLGLDPRQALYEVSALIGCVNLLLLGLLLRRLSPGVPAAPFLLFYGLALSSWLFYSVPESWPLSTTLLLGFLWVTYVRRWPWWGLALYLGVAMLNNLLLGVLGIFIALREAGERPWPSALVRSTAAAGVMVATWLALLTGLSPLEAGLRPDHFVAYTLWFKRTVAFESLPLSDPYVWKSALSNLFVTSVASNQADPMVPQEALLHTLRSGVLGAVVVLAYLVVLGVMAAALWRAIRATPRGGLGVVPADPLLHVAAFLGVFALTVVAFYYSGAFLYSMLALPLLTLLLARFVPGERWRWALLAGFLVILVVNNAVQVTVFRAALRALS